MKTRIILTLICAIAFMQLRAQRILVKSGIHANYDYTGSAHTRKPGLGGGICIEYGISSKLALGLTFDYNYSVLPPFEPYIRKKHYRDLMIQPEFKYYPKAVFNGFFIGANIAAFQRKTFGFRNDIKSEGTTATHLRGGLVAGYVFKLNNNLMLETRAGFSKSGQQIYGWGPGGESDAWLGLGICIGFNLGWRF
jgi:hypothetical protein